jgi:hypothetical protein
MERGPVADEPQRLQIPGVLRLVEDDTAALRFCVEVDPPLESHATRSTFFAFRWPCSIVPGNTCWNLGRYSLHFSAVEYSIRVRFRFVNAGQGSVCGSALVEFSRADRGWRFVCVRFPRSPHFIRIGFW